MSVCATVLLLLLFAADPQVDRVNRRIETIESGKAKPGSVYAFTSAELNAWARSEIPTVVPEGLRQPRLEMGNGTATGYALVDFLKLRHAAGQPTSWLVSKLIEGEKPLKVSTRIRSSGGRATVYLQRVEIGGLAVSGVTLDFLIRTFFLPLYPNAKINKPFDLKYKMDRIEVTPAEARVYLKK